MEEESIELEEGEIVDYTPLERPTTFTSQTSTAGNLQYSDNSADEISESNDSDNDSDSPCFKHKKNKLKKLKLPKRPLSQNNHSKSKNYNIWCTEVQESALTEELLNCGVRQGSYERNRDVESYDYHLAFTLEDTDREGGGHDVPQSNKRCHEERTNVKQRLGKRTSVDVHDQIRGDAKIVMDLIVTLQNTDQEVAEDIANKLCESKHNLILKVVEVIGKEKAIKLFVEAQRIETNGGMLIMNGARRKTSGGIFLSLLKQDREISKVKLVEIFGEDQLYSVARKRAQARAQARARRDKTEELRRKLSADGALKERDGPILPTLEHLASSDKDGDDGDLPVTNPPPSPATDGRENGSELLESMHLQVASYGDDFLDITSETMEEF